MKRKIPAVSIIIPMYNAEKYIGECLDSILAQTFTDYEVIVVDDCSTDKSCEVVESYLPKFDGGGGEKHSLIKSQFNSATPGIPRNTGIRFSCGEYVMFVDNDDAVTPTALEELYPVAKKFNADFVYCEKYYPVEYGEKFTTDKQFLKAAVRGDVKYDLVETPTLNSDDIKNRLEDYLNFKFWVAPWNYLIRRNFMTDNDICFPELRYGDDNFFVLFLVCLAKNIVRVPNTIYVYRNRKDSLGHSESLKINVRRYTDHFFQGVSVVNKFSEKFIFLKQQPEIKYKIFDFLAGNQFSSIAPFYDKIPLSEIDSLLRNEIKKLEETTALTAFLCNRMNIFNLNLLRQNFMIRQKDEHINKQNKIILHQQVQIENLMSQRLS